MALIHETVVDQIAQLVAELQGGAAVADLAGKNLIKDVKLDSLDFINLLFRLEEIYAIKVPEPDIDTHDLAVTAKLAAYIAERAK